MSIKKEKVKKHSNKIIAGIIACVLSVIYAIYGCPIKYITGISCAGCGMTRALWAAGRMHFAEAYHYHPLWPLLIVWIPIWFFRKKINKNLFKVLVGITVLAFILVYLYRMFYVHDNIVVFEPQNGVVGKLFNKFK